jgi:hypothetical protein
MHLHHSPKRTPERATQKKIRTKKSRECPCRFWVCAFAIALRCIALQKKNLKLCRALPVLGFKFAATQTSHTSLLRYVRWIELNGHVLVLAVGCGPFDAFTYVTMAAIPALVLAECWYMKLPWKFSIPILALVKTATMLVTLGATNLVMGEDMLARSVAHLVAMLDKAGLSFGSFMSSRALYFCVWMIVLTNSTLLVATPPCLLETATPCKLDYVELQKCCNVQMRLK